MACHLVVAGVADIFNSEIIQAFMKNGLDRPPVSLRPGEQKTPGNIKPTSVPREPPAPSAAANPAPAAAPKPTPAAAAPTPASTAAAVVAKPKSDVTSVSVLTPSKVVSVPLAQSGTTVADVEAVSGRAILMIVVAYTPYAR